jgi:hypothetical protein
MHHNLILDECHVQSESDIINKILFFENNNQIYNDLINKQRYLLKKFYIDKPLSDLYEKYLLKSNNREKEFSEFSDFFYVKNKDCYPPFKEGYYLEEYFYYNQQSIQKTFDKNGRLYIPALWTNFQIESWFNEKKELMQESLNNFIKNNPSEKGYFTIVQYDDGPLLKLPSNTLVYGACAGDIPLPLIYEDKSNKLDNYQKINYNNKKIYCSFVGSITHHIRATLFSKFKENTNYYFSVNQVWSSTVCNDSASNFINITLNSKFVFAPRGYGRSSFRFFEILKLGSIPIYVWDDIEWLPYKSILDYDKFCISINIKNIDELEEILSKIDEEKYNEMINEYQKIKDYFNLDYMCYFIKN